MWQEYEGDQWSPDPRRRRSAKGHPISNHIPTEMDEEIEWDTKKNVESIGNKAITKKIVPIHLHLQLFLRHILLFMYFIYDVMYSNINKLLNQKYYHF